MHIALWRIFQQYQKLGIGHHSLGWLLCGHIQTNTLSKYITEQIPIWCQYY
jgi:hypothetical protein